MTTLGWVSLFYIQCRSDHYKDQSIPGHELGWRTQLYKNVLMKLPGGIKFTNIIARNFMQLFDHGAGRQLKDTLFITS